MYSKASGVSVLSSPGPIGHLSRVRAEVLLNMSLGRIYFSLIRAAKVDLSMRI